MFANGNEVRDNPLETITITIRRNFVIFIKYVEEVFSRFRSNTFANIMSGAAQAASSEKRNKLNLQFNKVHNIMGAHITLWMM